MTNPVKKFRGRNEQRQMTQVGKGIEDGADEGAGAAEGAPSECDRIAASRALKKAERSPRRGYEQHSRWVRSLEDINNVLPTLDKDKRRHLRDVVLLRDIGNGIDVAFQESNVQPSFRQFFILGCDRMTRTAPRSCVMEIRFFMATS